MAHPRQTIRDAVITALIAAEITDDRVESNRKWPVEEETELPIILVYNGDETSQIQEFATDKLLREGALSVEAVTQTSEDDDLDDALDDLAEDIETAMKSDPTFGGLCIDSTLISTKYITDIEAQKPTGSVILTYNVRYEA